MTNYLVTAQAEVLVEKAYGILAKYARFTNYDDSNTPECIKKIEDNLTCLADRIVLCNTQNDIEKVKENLVIYENIIDNISILCTKGICS